MMMNNKVIFVVIFLLTALLFIKSYAQKEQFQVKQVTGNEIIINAGSRDGVEAGFTGSTYWERQLRGKMHQITTSQFRIIAVDEVSCRARLESTSATDPVKIDQKVEFDQELKRPIRQVGLTIVSNPSGATVYLEGRQRGETPLELTLNPGTYHMRLSKAGYDEVSDTLILIPDQPLWKSYTLNHSAPEKYTFFIDTIPADAKVIVNGIERGRTPLTLDMQDTNILIRIEKENYEPVEEKVILTDQYTTKTVWLKQSTLSIRISSVPSGARIYIDGQDLGVLPVDQQINKGKHWVRIEKEGYRTIVEEIELYSSFEKTFSLEATRPVNYIPPKPRSDRPAISPTIKKVGFGPEIGLCFATQNEEGTQNAYKMGFALGGLISYKLSDEFSLIGQFLYIKKGYKYSRLSYPSTYEYDLTLNYLELPILGRYSFGLDNFRIFLFIGPALAFKISGSFNWTHDGQYVEGADLSHKGVDLGLKVGGGLGCSLGSSWLMCELGITLGLVHTLDYATNTNTAILIMLSYLFGRY